MIKSKLEIRREMRALRETFRDSGESRCALERLTALPEWNAAHTVLLYSSIPGEVDTSELFSEWSGTKRLVLPLVVGDDLVLKEYRPGSLVPGYKGIMEPREDAPSVEASDIELVIVPGVAFDASGRRLGRGKGYYDRLLPRLHCPKVGLAFDWQIVGSVPVDEWDVPLDRVVSSTTVF